MTQSSTDFAQLSATHNNANTASRKEKEATTAARAVSPIASSQNCDILLSNFQIKKKRYRVLLNYDHIVWEQLQSKRNSDADAECNLKQSELILLKKYIFLTYLSFVCFFLLSLLLRRSLWQKHECAAYKRANQSEQGQHQVGGFAYCSTAANG